MAIKATEVTATMPAPQVAIYVRISKDREGQELGVERQEEDCRKIAERLNLPVYHVYKDNDKGASTKSTSPRKDYGQMLADAKQGYFSTIIAYSSSRLTRRPMEHEGQIELAEKYGIRYEHVSSPSFDLNTAAGRMIARVLAAKDAAEAEESAERVARAKLQRAEQGQYLGGYRAYGYEGAQYDDDGSLTNKGRINIAVVQHEADIYRMCVQRIINGDLISTIVHDLNRDGIPSPDGKQWDYGNTKRILVKQRYVIFDDNDPEKRGTLEHHNKTYRAAWPGLITRAQYELMMFQLEERSQKWKHGLSGGHIHLLSGIVFCGICGGVCHGRSRTLRNGTYQRRYVCRPRDNSGNRLGCGSTFRGAEPLDDWVTDCVLDRLDDIGVRAALAANPDEEADAAVIAELTAKLAQQKKHREQLVIEYGEGLHSLQDYKLMLDAADNAIAQTRASLAKAQHSDANMLIPPDQSVRELWPTANIDWRRSVIKLVVEKVIINPGHPGAHMYKNKWRFVPEHNEIVWREVAKSELQAQVSMLVSMLADTQLAA